MNIINNPGLEKIFQTDKRTNRQKTFDPRRSVNVWNNPGGKLRRKTVKFIANHNDGDKKNYLAKVSCATKLGRNKVEFFDHYGNYRYVVVRKQPVRSLIFRRFTSLVVGKNMRNKPVVVVSRCLGFGVCRWNGVAIESRLVAELEGDVDFLPVCPECEVGLGVPRQPIRLVRKKLSLALVQPRTGIDLTRIMVKFSEKFLQSLDRVDGFILKRKSPSCGLAGIPIYESPDSECPLNRNGSGFFAQAAHELFPHIPKEDEGCLDSGTFLEQIFHGTS